MGEQDNGPSSRFETIVTKIDPTLPLDDARGQFGEAFASIELGGSTNLIEETLEAWRNSDVQGKRGVRSAANHPDWLVMEGNQIQALVEVKCITSDLPLINEQKADYQAAWQETLPEVKVSESWQRRLGLAWRDKGKGVLSQMRSHLTRAGELNEAGVIDLAPDPSLILYVPEGQQFDQWPTTITYSNSDGEKKEATLEVKLLPPIEEVNQALLKNGNELSERKQPNRAFHSPADVVRERAEKIRMVYGQLKQAFETETIEETDQAVLKLLVGEKNISVGELMSQLSSAAPTPTAELTFTAAGKKLPGISKKERVSYENWLKEKGVDPQEGLSALQAANKMQRKLKRKGLGIDGLNLPSSN